MVPYQLFAARSAGQCLHDIGIHMCIPGGGLASSALHAHSAAGCAPCPPPQQLTHHRLQLLCITLCYFMQICSPKAASRRALIFTANPACLVQLAHALPEDQHAQHKWGRIMRSLRLDKYLSKRLMVTSTCPNV